METFSALLALCAGKSLVTGESPPPPTKQWHGDMMLFWSASKRNWANTRDTGDDIALVSFIVTIAHEILPIVLLCHRLVIYTFLIGSCRHLTKHYNDVTMSKIASQITSLAIVYSTVYSDPGQTKHQSSASLAFVRGIHRGPVNSSHKWPVTRKMFPFDDVIMIWGCIRCPLNPTFLDDNHVYIR